MRVHRQEKEEVRRVSIWNLTNLIFGSMGALFILSLAVVLVLQLRSIYYYDISSQNLVESTGLSEEVIRRNYDVLIDYNLIGGAHEGLEFPDFPMSDEGRIHFKEVKRIFLLIQYLCILTGVVFLIGLVKKLKKKDAGILHFTAIFTLLIPTVLGVLMLTNWEGFFTGFHKLMFHNDYWLFDPVRDPVINILPDAFFLHCAVAILVFVILGSILTGALYRFLCKVYK